MSDTDYWMVIAIWLISAVAFISIVMLIYLNIPGIKLPDKRRNWFFWAIAMISGFFACIFIIGAILSGFRII